MFPPQDVAVVRDLARRTTGLAHSDEYEARRERWRDVNERRKPDRAPVWCWGRPEGFWKEVLPQSALQSTDPFCRNVEYTLRQILYKDCVGDDQTFEPCWAVGAVFDRNTPFTWGDLHTRHLVGSTDLGGFRYDPPIKTEADYARITVPTFTYNHEKTQRALSRMHDLLGDTLEVRLACGPPLGPALGTYLEQLRGMAPLMEDMAFRPHLVHQAMARLTEGVLRAMRAAEASGLLTANHDSPVNRPELMFYSDPVNGVPNDGVVRLHSLWTLANSQEFDQVSPRMQEEFLLNYQTPLFQQYGAVQYGCCENLTQKIGSVLRIPNLRRFVCSAWTDLDKVIDACGTRYTIQWRQHAASVVYPDDLESIRRHLDEGMRKLQGHYYQVALREVETLQSHPNRLREWTQLAIASAEKYA